MLGCYKVSKLVSLKQDSKLTLWQRWLIAMHHLMCTGCRNFGKNMDVLRQITKQVNAKKRTTKAESSQEE